MRVLHLSDRASSRGGADWHLSGVIEAQMERGLSVTVPVAAWESGGVREWHPGGDLLVPWGEVDELARDPPAGRRPESRAGRRIRPRRADGCAGGGLQEVGLTTLHAHPARR